MVQYSLCLDITVAKMHLLLQMHVLMEECLIEFWVNDNMKNAFLRVLDNPMGMLLVPCVCCWNKRGLKILHAPTSYNKSSAEAHIFSYIIHHMLCKISYN